MKQSFYENGIQGLAYNTSDAMVACDLDDPGVRTLAVRVDMPEGMVECHMNVDRLGCCPPELGQKEFDLAVKAAKLFVAAPELLAALEEVKTELFWMDHGPRDSDREAFARRVNELRGLCLTAIAKAKGGEG
jgi:hypothetical protein